MTKSCFAIALGLLAISFASARDWHVDQEKGNDRDEGTADQPLKSIAMGVKKAEAGDTIHLVKTGSPYQAGITFHNKSGEPGKPITLDGHGVTLSGAAPLDPDDWKLIKQGLFASSTLLDRPDRAIVDRFFFLFDGKMNRMGRSLKGPAEPWRKPAELKPGEWCWVEEEQAFYLKIDPGQSLSDAQISAPLVSNGVAISGDCNHLVIRNLTSTHVYNDGFNIHGKTRDVRFKDIRAIECGDDGVSAHGDCRIVIDGLVSIGNSTGVCHVNDSHTEGSRHYIEGCHGFAYFVLDSGVHSLRDSVLVCDAKQSVVVNGPRKESDAVCHLAMENVWIRGTGKSDIIKSNRRTAVRFNHVTATGLSISAAGRSFVMRDSAIGGLPKPYVVVYPETKWEAGGNIFDLDYLRIGPDFYNADTFEKYQNNSGQGSGSVWRPFKIEGKNLKAGADHTRLPSKSKP